MAVFVGSDIGGTFTDIVFLGDDGERFTKKVSSTVDDYARAIVDGLSALIQERGLRSRDIIVPAAQKQADLETASYGAGRASLADVLGAFTDLAEAKLDTLEREAAVARDAVRINFTYGSQAQ